MRLTVSGMMSCGGTVTETGVFGGPWNGWQQYGTFTFVTLGPVLKLSIRRASEYFRQA